MMSQERLNVLCEFIFDEIEISLFFYKQGCENWQEKERNACQLKARV